MRPRTAALLEDIAGACAAIGRFMADRGPALDTDELLRSAVERQLMIIGEATSQLAKLDPEMAADPLVTEVGWSWLMECLSGHRVEPVAASGTVTRVASESFGAMSERPASAEIEIRASWTPTDAASLGDHLEAWSDLLCTAAGLPPLPAGVVPLGRR